jgi:hypothetical protein
MLNVKEEQVDVVVNAIDLEMDLAATNTKSGLRSCKVPVIRFASAFSNQLRQARCGRNFWPESAETAAGGQSIAPGGWSGEARGKLGHLRPDRFGRRKNHARITAVPRSTSACHAFLTVGDLEVFKLRNNVWHRLSARRFRSLCEPF